MTKVLVQIITPKRRIFSAEMRYLMSAGEVSPQLINNVYLGIEGFVSSLEQCQSAGHQNCFS